MEKDFSVKRCVLILLCVVSAGCMTFPGGTLRSLTRADQLQNGMTREEVNSIMGDQVVIGYEITDVKQGTTKPITVHNPQRTETVSKGAVSYDVVYYFTHIVKADGRVTDDELTPLIFEKGHLVGKGWYVLNKIRKP